MPARLPCRRRTRRLAAGAAGSLSMVLALASARADGALDAYLPKGGTIEGHVMRLGVAPEDQALNMRFRAAVRNNMDWFKKYVTSNKPDAPMPYDPHMNITEAQYDRLQHMHAEFQPGDAITIKVSRRADGSTGFQSDNAAAAGLGNVTFGPGETAARTPEGDLSIFNTIHQTDEKAPIGLWTGAEWARVAEPGAASPSAKIAFGKREPSGEGVMYYQVAPTKDREQQSLVVFYKLD